MSIKHISKQIIQFMNVPTRLLMVLFFVFSALNLQPPHAVSGDEAVPIPTISTTGELLNFNSTEGGNSDEQSYKVSANNLTSELVITAPEDFEISTNTGDSFGASIILTPDEFGIVEETVIYVRLSAIMATEYSASITHVSIGAIQVDVEVRGSSVPFITITSTLNSFISEVGANSNEQSYIVAGSNLTDNLVIRSPVDFEISTVSGGPYTATISLTPINGILDEKPIFVLMNRTVVGPITGNISHTSTGATEENLPVTGEATEPIFVMDALDAGPLSHISDIGNNSIKDSSNVNLVITTSETVAAGDDIIIAYATDPTQDLTINIADSAGNTYYQAAMAISVGNLRTYIFAAYNVTELTSGSTITITQTVVSSTAVTARAAVVSVFQGLAPVGALEQTNVGSQSGGTTPSSGAVNTIQADQLLIGAVGTEGPIGDSAGTWLNSFNEGPRTGTTGGTNNTNITVSLGWQVVSAAGSYTAAKSGITSSDSGTIIATFKNTDAGISYIGNIGSAQTKASAGTSLDITTTSTVAAGDDILVAVTIDGNTDPVSVTDGVNNYAQVLNSQFTTPSNTNVRTIVFAAFNASELPSGSIITITHPSVTARAAVASVFRGLADSGALDQTRTANGTTNTVSSGATSTTTQNDELLIGAVGLEGPNYDAPSVWQNSFTYGPRIGTNYGSGSGGGDSDVTTQMGWRIVGSTGAYTAQIVNLNTTRDWAAGIATFSSVGSGPTCYTLTMGHTGNGSTPVATPENSAGCVAGKYIIGELISLSGATPDSEWEISGWSGTVDDTSIANTNSLTMPAADHTSSVIYTEIEPIPVEITFTGKELLGRPTDSSISISIVPDATILLYYRYGNTPGGPYSNTVTETATGGQPKVVVINGLAANTQYYYRMVYSADGGATWVNRDEHSFWTQRAADSTFTFSITSDSHVNIMLGSSAEWTKTLNNIASESPDFEIDLGDTFAMDGVTTATGAETAYKYQLPFFNLISASAPIFLAPGNHEQQEAWHLDDTGDPTTSPPVIGTNAQKKFFLNPVPDSFYSGDLGTYSHLSGDQLRQDYYAWTWGDALFIVINPYWFTTTKPYTGNTGGGETSDTGSGDRWDWTLGLDQFNWLKDTLENSDAKFKFIFSHHMVGGSDDYVRGGANPANLNEWGGYNDSDNGATWGWDTKRSGWGSQPIHQMMVANGVSAFFHGHDHQFAYEKRDGIVYQSVPSAGFTGNGFNIYTTGSGYTIQALASDGHLLVTVRPLQTSVDYVRSSDASVAYSYNITPAPPNYDLTIAVDPVGGGTTNPTVGTYSYAQDTIVPVTATPNTGFTFSSWSGACTGSGTCAVTMDAVKTVTANFVEIPTFVLTTAVDPIGGGSINPAAGPHTYNQGDVVSITASPNSGYTFSSWSGACSGSGTCAVTMDAVKSVTANFVEIPTFVLTTAVDPIGGGSINPAAGPHTYNQGDVVSITASPNLGYTFSSWSGACTGSGTCAVTMDAVKTVTANFTATASEITFTGTELLSRPTDSSISISNVPDSDISLYYLYGTEEDGPYSSTSTVTVAAGQPNTMVISGLSANTKYYYRMRYSTNGGSTWVTRPEYSFWTARAKGSTYSFTITSDGHVNILLGSATTWGNTMDDVANDHADFELDLGDTVAIRGLTTGDITGAENAYKAELPFFNRVSSSSPIFLVPGNHEQKEAWHLLNPLANSLPVIGTNAQKKFFPNPIPNSFYSGDESTYSYLNGDHLRESYYSWTWGDALFVVIDPYWYTTTKPYVTDPGGGESDTTGSGDSWDWTLGLEQFTWFKDTLTNSNAKYKFVFAHQMVGGGNISGQSDYGHGGANYANLVEWGGYNENGTTWGWDTERPGWGSEPIHQMMVANGVSAFFHGHDHQYAYEKRDGVVYQSVPSGGFSNGFGIYTTGSGNTIRAMTSPGHLLITVRPTQTDVDYIQTSGSSSAYSYSIEPSSTTYDLTTAVDPIGGGTTDPAAGTHTYDTGTEIVVTATPATGYIFDHWSGACTGTGTCSVTMNATKSVTAVFKVQTYTISGNAGVTGVILNYTDGSAKTATAGSGGDYSFTVSYNWSGTVTPSLAGYTFTPPNRTYANVLTDQITQNYTATAITYTISGNAGVTGAILSYTDGSTKTATAGAGGDYSFNVSYNWSGNVTPALPGYIFTPLIRNYVNVQANQTNQNYTAVTSHIISGNAGVAGAVLSYSDGTLKTATAGAGGAYSFEISNNWSGIVTPALAGYNFTPPNRTYSNVLTDQTDQNYIATVSTYKLTITLAGTGSGLVESIPSGIYCGTTCTFDFPVDTEVLLLASPVVTSTFTGWSGGDCSGTGGCSLTMDSDKTETVTFETGSNILRILKSGGGTITTEDGGINCGFDCAQNYPTGEEVTLTATPSTGYAFTGWSGGICTGINTCTLIMNSPTTELATFVSGVYTISGDAGVAGATLTYTDGTIKTVFSDADGNYFIIIPANWSGSITPSLDGYTFTPLNRVYTNILSNQTDQNYTATSATPTISGNTGMAGVVLSYTDGSPKTATTGAGGSYSFAVSDNWSGVVTPALTGFTFTPPSRTYTNVTSNQTLQDYTSSTTLAVVLDGTGTGTVASSPPGIDCGADCSQAYNYGTIVTLTAVPTAGGYNRFIGWSGAGCSGIGTCIATVDAAKTVTATFQKTTFSDVPFTHPNWAYIEALWDNGFTSGCQAAGEPLKFCPEQTMLRAESAVFMLRGKLGAIGTPTDAEPYVFGDDWSGIEWAIPWAEKMWDEGMTAGCQYPAGADPKLFCPYTLFTRDMGAVFALRIKHGSDMPVPVGTGQVFADMTDLVSSDGIGVGWAEQAYAEGLIPDCGIDPVSTKPKFCPFDQLDRSWSAYMIVKAKGMTIPE